MPGSLPASLTLPKYALRSSSTNPSRAYRVMIGSAILLGLVAVLYTALTGDLFLPARDALAAGKISEAILRPSILWVIMGLTMLTIRTLLWFRYQPFEPASMQTAPTMTVV